MSTHKHINLICVIVTVCALLITVLFMNGEALGIEKIVDTDAESYTGSELFTENDMDGDWDASGATVITLDGTDAQVSGGGAYVLDGSVYITNAGYYRVTGTLTNGSVVVDAYQSSKVWVMLDHADISCEEDAAFRVNQADKVFLTLAAGTENSLRAGETYSDAALSDNAGGAIFSHDDLTINGSGTLTVTAGYKHGIDVNDSLVITGGTITVTAPEDGLHVNDSLRITGADITLEAGDDALKCDVEIIVESGTILVTDCYEGFEAPQITVTGGDITIYPQDDGFNANSAGGGSDIGFITGETTTSAETADIDPWIDISGGTITIINETGRDADGLDSNGDIYISGGSVRVSLTDSGTNSAIDYASESGGVCVITGGEVIACGSYSMAEHFDASSTQSAVLYNFSAGVEAGTVFALEDADGKVLLSWDVPCSYSSVNVSCPALVTGETYVLVIGDQEEEITVTEVSASYGDVQSTGFGGMFNQGGGMRQRGGFGNTGGAAATSPVPSGDTLPSRGGQDEMPTLTEEVSGDTDATSPAPSGGTLPSRGGQGTPPTPPEGMTPQEGMTPPEGMEEGEMPTPPEGMEEGEMPTPPEGMTPQEGMTPPEGMTPQALTEEASAATGTTATATALSDYSADTWLELGTAAVILLLGIGIALLYQRRGRARA